MITPFLNCLFKKRLPSRKVLKSLAAGNLISRSFLNCSLNEAVFSNFRSMKRLFILFLILGLPTFFYAQTVLVSNQIPLKTGDGYEILGKLKDRYLLFKETFDSQYEIRGYDTALKLKWTKELEFDTKRPKVLNISATKNDFSIIYQYVEKGKTTLKAHKYDPGANLLDSITIYSFKGSVFDAGFQIVQSENKSKLLIYQIENQKAVKALAFDVENMKMLWSCEFLPVGLAFQRDFIEVLVSDNATMFFILGKDNNKNKKEDHVYDIYVGNEETASKSITYFTFPMNEKLTFDIVFNYDNLNNRIVAGGLYSEKTKTKSVGYFYLNLSADNPEDYTLSFEPFDDDFVSNFLGKQVDAAKGLNEAVVQEIILRRDGGILMVGEQAVHSERQAMGAGSMGTGYGYVNYDYYYDDLFVISIHPNGETHWKTILHKRQYSYDDDASFSSYFLMKTATSLSFVFNDDIKYENTVSEYILKGDGKSDRNSILNTKNKKIRLLFRRGVQVGSNEYIIPSEFRNRLSLVKFKY